MANPVLEQEVDIPEVSKVVKTLEMSIEQKAQILLQQRQTLTIQNTITQLQKQLEQQPTAMNSLLTQIALELKVDPQEIVFDLDKLTVGYKAK